MARPKTSKEGVSKGEEAEEIKKKFADAGAKIELKWFCEKMGAVAAAGARRAGSRVHPVALSRLAEALGRERPDE
jgi:hypothetical protein